MILLSGLDFSLPLTNPVIVFSLVLFIILFAPIIFNKIRVPHIIGLILAGVLVGPYGLNLLSRDASIVLFGTVGLLYILFLAGLEIDLTEFAKNRNKILFFGLTTFLFPLTVGTVAGYYVLGYDLVSALLLASMICTHTLIAYPIASRYGIARNRGVTLAIGATMITDILALLMLAVIAGTARQEASSSFWISLGISTVAFVCTVFFLFPIIIRWFFKKFEDSVSQYIFVLAIVFLSSFLAEVAGLEAIIGAFFSGLVLNKFVPHSSPLMNRIDFVGNALFIPFFLISVGMLVDMSVLFKGWGPIKVILVIVTASFIGKFSAAWATRKVFGLSALEGRLMYGLSASHAAATLAIVLVGFNIIIGETATGEPIRLLNEDVLNAAVILILISCTTSSFVVEKASRAIALEDESRVDEAGLGEEKILISVSETTSVNDLVDLGLMLKRPRTVSPVYALHIITDEAAEKATEKQGRKIMQQAAARAAATENVLVPISRYDASISNGIIYTIKEQSITDLIIGVHHNADEKTLLGPTVEQVLRGSYEAIYVYRAIQPLNTISTLVVVVTPQAELEPGFGEWCHKLFHIAQETGAQIRVYASPPTLQEVEKELHAKHWSVKLSATKFTNWDDFLILGREVGENDLFVIVAARKGHVSYNHFLEKTPYYLHHYFKDVGFLIIYPKQLEQGVKMDDVQHVDGTLIDTITESADLVNKAGKYIKNLFKKDE